MSLHPGESGARSRIRAASQINAPVSFHRAAGVGSHADASPRNDVLTSATILVDDEIFVIDQAALTPELEARSWTTGLRSRCGGTPHSAAVRKCRGLATWVCSQRGASFWPIW